MPSGFESLGKSIRVDLPRSPHPMGAGGSQAPQAGTQSFWTFQDKTRGEAYPPFDAALTPR